MTVTTEKFRSESEHLPKMLATLGAWVNSWDLLLLHFNAQRSSKVAQNLINLEFQNFEK